MTQAYAILESITDTPTIQAYQESLVPRVRLKVEGLTIAFGGQQVLRGVNLDLTGGQIALLRGANGCGKTVEFKDTLGVCRIGLALMKPVGINR